MGVNNGTVGTAVPFTVSGMNPFSLGPLSSLELLNVFDLGSWLMSLMYLLM